MPFDTFGGGVVNPAEVSYRAVALTADVTLYWPSLSLTSTDVVARTMDVTPSTSGLDITMPDARETSTGMSVLFRNLGAETFTILSSTGTTIGTVATGVAKYFYLTDNSTQAGSWSVVTFGTGTSSADASTLAGYGLKAIGITLNQKYDVTETSSNVTIVSTDRAKTYVWTGGTLTCTLPTSGSVGSDFFFIAKNAGSGTITITPSGADTIDGAASLALAPNDGCIVYSGGSSNTWYTVGKGQEVAFAFTQLVKNVAGSSNVTLTAAECANKVMTFTGALTGNIEVRVTNTVSVYYVYNNTSGAYTLTLKTAAGTGIAITQGAHDIGVCDATNVYRGIDNTVGTVLFDVGSESAPSITFIGDPNTGIYHPAADQIAVTTGGTDSMRWNAEASSVNAIDVYASATGNPVSLRAYGDDSNISFFLRPKGTGTTILQDGNGNEVLISDAGTASAVNEITLTNAATGNPPIVKASGGDTNISLALRPKGTGTARVQDGTDPTKQAAFDASSITTGTVRTFTFPDATGTLVLATATQTLTNKKLTNPEATTQALTDGATINWDASSGEFATVTLGGNRTMAAPTNLKAGTYILMVTQDGTGSRTITWNSVFKWPAGVAPTLTTTAGATDVFSFVCNGTNMYGSFLPNVS